MSISVIVEFEHGADLNDVREVLRRHADEVEEIASLTGVLGDGLAWVLSRRDPLGPPYAEGVAVSWDVGTECVFHFHVGSWEASFSRLAVLMTDFSTSLKFRFVASVHLERIYAIKNGDVLVFPDADRVC